MTNIEIIKLQPVLLRLNHAAEFLDVPVETLRSWTRAGRIPSVKIGRCRSYLVRDLVEFADRHRIGGGA